MLYALYAVIGIIVGAAGTYGLLAVMGRNALRQAREQAEHLREEARRQRETRSKEIEISAQQDRLRLKEAFDREAEAQRKALKEQEQRLSKREDTLDHKLDTLSVKEKNLETLESKLSQRDSRLAAKEKQAEQMVEEQRQKLLQITGLSPDAAKEILLQRIEEECRRDAGVLIQRITEQAQEEAKEKSRQIVLQAIQRYAAEQTCDHTVSTVAIPNDDMKGRVIGREGRNIRSFEKATGVDVIIDDTPGVVVVSCFDPVRREVARQSLEKLVQDGRIHPARIEELVAQTSKEMEEELLRIGKEAVQEANLSNIAKPIIPMLGRLGYRTSYG